MTKTFLKTYIAEFLAPAPIIGFIIIVLGFALFKRKERLIKWSYISLFFMFFFNTCNLMPDYILNKYENVYPKYQTTNKIDGVKYIVVLGGGLVPAKTQPITSELTHYSLTRLIEGLRILNSYPKAKLIVSGSGYAKLTEAEAMGILIEQLGISREVILDKISKNTYEHTVNLKPILKNSKFIMVTSALHMPRAMAYFESAGMKPIPAPTQFILKGNYQGLFENILLYPNGENLYAMDKVFYEIWGYLVGIIRGRIKL